MIWLYNSRYTILVLLFQYMLRLNLLLFTKEVYDLIS